MKVLRIITWLWISPLSSILQVLLLYSLCSFLSTFTCTCNVNVKSCDSNRLKWRSFFFSVEKGTLNSWIFCMLWKRWRWWQYCGLKYKKSINTNVDNVLVSQLLIKATYFLYRFNYLFSRVQHCVGCWFTKINNTIFLPPGGAVFIVDC